MNSVDALLEVWATSPAESIDTASDAVAHLPAISLCNQSAALLAGPPPPEPGEVKVVAGLLDAVAKADAQLTSGLHNLAQETLASARETATSIVYPSARAKYFQGHARLLASSSKLEESEVDFRQAIQLAAQAGDLQLVAHIWAELYYLVGVDQLDFDKSSALLEPLQAAVSLAKDDFSLAISHSYQASVYRLANRLQEASEHGRIALKLFSEIYGPDHPQVATIATNLGLTLHGIDELEEAEALHRRALAIFKKRYGLSHERTASAYSNLGGVQLDRIEDEAAHESFLAAENALVATLGPEHLKVAQIASNRSVALVNLGRYQEARQALERALAIYKAQRPDDPRIGIFLGNLARAYSAEGKLAETAEKFRAAIAFLEPALGSEHGQVLFFTSELALTLAKQDKCEEAQPLFVRVKAGIENSELVDIDSLATVVEGQAGCEPSSAKSLALLETALKLRQGPGNSNPVAMAYLKARIARALRTAQPARSNLLSHESVEELLRLGGQFANEAAELAAEFDQE